MSINSDDFEGLLLAPDGRKHTNGSVTSKASSSDKMVPLLEASYDSFTSSMTSASSYGFNPDFSYVSTVSSAEGVLTHSCS